MSTVDRTIKVIKGIITLEVFTVAVMITNDNEFYILNVSDSNKQYKHNNNQYYDSYYIDNVMKIVIITKMIMTIIIVTILVTTITQPQPPVKIMTQVMAQTRYFYISFSFFSPLVMHGEREGGCIAPLWETWTTCD